MKIKNIIINTRRLFIVIIILLIIIFVLIFVIFKIDNFKNKNTITHDSNSSFFFTNPILDCESENQNSSAVVFSGNVARRVNSLKSEYSLDHISLYFRDLNNGPWIGVNEMEVFSPASLLKVPIMIAFLHQAESDPSILSKKILINNNVNNNYTQNIKPVGGAILNYEYTIDQLMQNMIEKSDNISTQALLQNINTDYISGVFKSVGVPYKDTNTELAVTVKDYSGFFRVLFNASYLDRNTSEKALEILSKSEYLNGLVAGVPKNIVVAHKFGERNIEGENDEMQFHDCGIIYYPGKPYILCIMTRGNSLVNQEKVIKNLSSYIYNEVDKNK